MLAFFGKGTISLSDEVDSLQASNPGSNLSDGVGNVLLVSNEPSKDFRSSRFNFDQLAQEDSFQKPLPRSPHTRFEPVAKGSKRYWDSSGNGFSDSPMVLAQSMPRVSSGQAMWEVSAIVREDVQYPIDVYDPMEGFNRRVYKFNAQFDEYVFLPVVRGYETVMPDYVEDRISNFFNNVLDIRNLINSALQLKGQTTLTTGGRFLINTILGIGGLWDHATGWGLPQQPEDFGQTLGHYGVGDGPFLVLPIFGPSNVRDTAGFGVDLAARYFYLSVPLGLDDSTAGALAYTLSNSIDTRHQLHFRYYQTGSPFEYDLVRLLYTKKRELDIGK
jgi:phospholipid-binding lipoprotein MlaA